MITPTVAEQIIEVIECLAQKFGIAIDWSAENLLPFAEHLSGRIVDWKIAQSWFWIIFCGIFFIAGIVCTICSFKVDDYGFSCGLGLLGTLALLGFGAGLGVYIYELVKALTFPELAILEYIKTFIQ